MQFLDIQTRVAQETGLDITTDATMIKAWINGAYQQLSGFFEWPWLLTNFILQTEADITDKTASVTAGGTTVTFNVAPSANSLASYYMIKFTDSPNTGDWYFISTHTANTNTCTISVPYTGSTNYVAGACKIRRILYNLPTNIDRLADLRQSVTKLKIELIDRLTFDKMVPDPDNTGTPTYAYLSGMVASGSAKGAWQLSLYPLPNAVINIQGRGYITVTELSADSDTPLLPPKWHNALVFLSLALYGHDYIDDSRVQSAMAKSKEIMAEMLKEFNPFPGELHVIQPWDTRTPRGLLGVRLPSNFPWPWGI